MAHQWYAIQTHSGSELVVKRALETSTSTATNAGVIMLFFFLPALWTVLGVTGLEFLSLYPNRWFASDAMRLPDRVSIDPKSRVSSRDASKRCFIFSQSNFQAKTGVFLVKS